MRCLLLRTCLMFSVFVSPRGETRMRQSYARVLKSIKDLINRGNFGTDGSAKERNILRIGNA